MQIINLNQTPAPQAIQQAVTVLEQGGLVIYPTETLYGAGVEATNQQAVNKLLAYKSRREGKPLSIAVCDQVMAERYVELSPQAQDLYQRFLPGPYTIVSKNKGVVAQGVASEFDTLGIRVPDHKLILNLVKALDKPITATSANSSGQRRPYQVNHILNNISNQQRQLIDLVLDAGQLKPNPPSTVIDTTLSTPLTMRRGAGDWKGGGEKEVDEGQSRLISRDPKETKQIAGKLMLKYWSQIKEQGLLVGLDGQLGAGKTIFAKGIAQFLQITKTITSPTYTYLKQYPYQRHGCQGTFHHLDTWKIDTAEQFATLQVPSLLKPGNVVAVEWWGQVKNFLQTEPKFKSVARLDIKLDLKQQTRTLIVTSYD
jgi:L-threonylcarbamoyladenylate synthase